MITHDAESIVLIVDDNKANLSLLTDQLLAQGFQLMVAESGESALERVRFRRPDIILMDVRMPGIDGFETCRRLKADPTLAAVPVIFLSSLSDADDKIQGFQAGGVDYVAKPLDLTEVLLRLRTHLAMRHLQNALAQSNADLEQRVAARTAELQAEVARRTQSEAEKVLLLDAIRTQSEHLQSLGNQLLAQQSQRRADLSAEMNQQVFQDLSTLRSHLDTLLDQDLAPKARHHAQSMDHLINNLLNATQQVVAHLQEVSPEESALQANPLLKLSEREREVLLLMVKRYSIDEIASLLHVTSSSVRTYRYRMLQKLDVADDTDLLRYARQYKLMQFQ